MFNYNFKKDSPSPVANSFPQETTEIRQLRKEFYRRLARDIPDKEIKILSWRPNGSCVEGTFDNGIIQHDFSDISGDCVVYTFLSGEYTFRIELHLMSDGFWRVNLSTHKWDETILGDADFVFIINKIKKVLEKIKNDGELPVNGLEGSQSYAPYSKKDVLALRSYCAQFKPELATETHYGILYHYYNDKIRGTANESKEINKLVDKNLQDLKDKSWTQKRTMAFTLALRKFFPGATIEPWEDHGFRMDLTGYKFE
jgi:hypothetical protein